MNNYFCNTYIAYVHYIAWFDQFENNWLLRILKNLKRIDHLCKGMTNFLISLVLRLTVNILIYFLVILGEQWNSFCTLSKCTHFYVHCKWVEYYLSFLEHGYKLMKVINIWLYYCIAFEYIFLSFKCEFSVHIPLRWILITLALILIWIFFS